MFVNVCFIENFFVINLLAILPLIITHPMLALIYGVAVLYMYVRRSEPSYVVIGLVLFLPHIMTEPTFVLIYWPGAMYMYVSRVGCKMSNTGSQDMISLAVLFGFSLVCGIYVRRI
jgi:hypothetical protein